MVDLAFWGYLDPAQLLTCDLGVVAARSSDDIQLRITNLDTEYTATGITVTVTGGAAAQLWLSDDGEVFGDSVQVGDVPALAASAPFWLRRVTPSTAAAGAYTAGLLATATGWSLPTAAPVVDIEPDDTEPDYEGF